MSGNIVFDEETLSRLFFIRVRQGKIIKGVLKNKDFIVPILISPKVDSFKNLKSKSGFGIKVKDRENLKKIIENWKDNRKEFNEEYIDTFNVLRNRILVGTMFDSVHDLLLSEVSPKVKVLKAEDLQKELKSLVKIDELDVKDAIKYATLKRSFKKNTAGTFVDVSTKNVLELAALSEKIFNIENMKTYKEEHKNLKQKKEILKK